MPPPCDDVMVADRRRKPLSVVEPGVMGRPVGQGLTLVRSDTADIEI